MCCRDTMFFIAIFHEFVKIISGIIHTNICIDASPSFKTAKTDHKFLLHLHESLW